jgi:hypothetical protein
MKRLRLLKIEIRPTFVLDDGHDLTELVAAPLTINGADWSPYVAPGGGFERAMADAEGRLPMSRTPSESIPSRSPS